MVRDKFTGAPRGFAFVQYNTIQVRSPPERNALLVLTSIDSVFWPPDE